LVHPKACVVGLPRALVFPLALSAVILGGPAAPVDWKAEPPTRGKNFDTLAQVGDSLDFVLSVSATADLFISLAYTVHKA